MKDWRARHYRLQIGRRRLHITVRRFYAPASRRSTRYRQLVINLDLGPLKEVAVRAEKVRRRPGRPTSKRPATFWQLRASFSTVLIVAGATGTGYFTTQLVAAHSLQPAHAFTSAAPAEGLAAKALPYSVPTHISIPSVGIDAPLVNVGLNADGSIQMPPLLAWEAGWYEHSPAPGQVGPAIIVGHVDNYENISVFWRLRDVKRGDLVYISRADGKTVTFKITTLEQYDKNSFPTQAVYGNIAYPGIRIITCGGTFDEATHNYTQNTVVSGFIVS